MLLLEIHCKKLEWGPQIERYECQPDHRLVEFAVGVFINADSLQTFKKANLMNELTVYNVGHFDSGIAG